MLSLLIALGCASLIQTASAHDLWLIPPERAAAKSTVKIHANSGMDFPTSVNAPEPKNFKRRVLWLPDGSEAELSAKGTEGESGILQFGATAPGVHIVAVQSEPKLITLEADEFNHYLVVDGLPHIYLLRRSEGLLDKPGVERYSKSPKALLQVGEGGGGDPCRAVGLPLEITPLENPFAKKIGEALRVRVDFQGRPLTGANLGWDAPGDGEPPSGTIRTDGKGEALVPISQTGLMTIRLTHMTRPKAVDHEWESFWTTLTFRIP